MLGSSTHRGDERGRSVEIFEIDENSPPEKRRRTTAFKAPEPRSNVKHTFDEIGLEDKGRD